jgi:drug/metabolite transporter (DMT)-like permease
MFGVVLCLGAAVCASTKDVCSKILASRISPAASTFFSFAYAIPFYLLLLPIIYLFDLEVFSWSSSFLMVLALRALSDWGAESFKMKALAATDLSFAASFLALSPVFLLFLAPWITGDSVGWLGVLSVLFVVLGSLVLTWSPQGFQFSVKGALFALLSSLFFALNTCFDRLAVQDGGPYQAAFGVTILAGLLSLPTAWMSRSERGLWAVPAGATSALWSRGSLEVLFMMAKLTALTVLAPQYVVALMRVSVFLSTLAGLFVLREGDRLRRICASLLILCGVLLALGEVV